MLKETEVNFIEQLEKPENIIEFNKTFNQLDLPQLPENYKYKYCWNLVKMKSELKVQRRYFWKLWKTEFRISIEPKDTDMYSLMDELQTAGDYLSTRLDRKIFNKIMHKM